MSPENPHYKKLSHLLMGDFLDGRCDSHGLLGLSDGEFANIIDAFPFLSEAEKQVAIERIIQAYFAQATSNLIMRRVFSSSASATRQAPREHLPHDQQN